MVPAEDTDVAAAVAAAEDSPQAPSSNAEDEAARQAREWFNEDPATPEAPAAEAPAADTDEDDAEPAAVAQDVDADTDAAPAAADPEPAAAPMPPKPPPAVNNDDKPVPTPAPAPQRQVGQFDIDAAAQRAISELPGKVKIGDHDVDITGYLKDFPETPAIVAAVAGRIVQQAIGPLLPMLQQMQEQRAYDDFMGKVVAKVPNAGEIVATKEFQNWVRSQPRQLQEMASSDDPEAAVFVLKAYNGGRRPARQAPQATPAAVPPSPAFDRRKAIHAGTLGGKPAARGVSTPAAQTYKAAFNEDP